MTNSETLTCISIIVCENIYRDERTKNLVIIGTFNALRATAFPCVFPKMRILFTLTNGNGEYNLKLSIENERTGARIVGMEGPFRIDDPLAISDIDVELRAVPFPEPGKYWVTLQSDSETLQQRPLIVVDARPEGSHGNGC